MTIPISTFRQKFLLTIGLQLLIILGLILINLLPLQHGTSVFLRIRPVDPTDPFRGDYVALSYDITNLRAYQTADKYISPGDTVYVSLKDTGSYWTASSFSVTPPAGDQVYLAGTVTSGRIPNPYVRNMYENTFVISYGIEQYYVPEGMGRDQSIFTKNVGALVSVGPGGKASLRKLFVNSQPWP